MADTVNIEKIEDGPRNVVLVLTNLSDGTGESDVVKADISSFSNLATGVAATSLAVEAIEYDIQGFSRVDLEFDATADEIIAHLGTGQGYIPFDPPLADPKATGFTGDILLTTAGAASGASYTITLRLKKKS